MDRDFKGVWIPKELFLNETLSWAEKILLIEIDSLDQNGQGCFASNEYLAKFIQVSEGSMANMIVKLMNKGYIIKKGFDGRKRYISVNPDLTKILTQTSQNYEPSLHKNMNSDFTKILKQTSQNYEHINTVNNTLNNTFNNTDYNEKKDFKKSSSRSKKEIENIEDVPYFFELNQILELLTERTGAKYNLPKTPATLKKYQNYTLVKSLLENGNSLELILSVIEFKCKEWLPDAKMCINLTPSVLFRQSNFEKYIIQSQIKSINNQTQQIKDDKGNYADTQAGREQFITDIREGVKRRLEKRRNGETDYLGF